MFKQSMRETMRKHSGRAPAVTASTPTRRRFLHLAAGAVAFPAVSRITRAHAQVYPNKLIKMILPYTAGSPNDVLARLVTPGLSSQLGQTVVIDNRPGGGTSIGTRVVMTAEPDGYTLLWAASPSHFIIPYVSKTFTYDPLKDFLPIASVGTNSNVLVIVPSVPAKTLPELIAYAKANPGKLSFAFGQGTFPHLLGELFKLETGIEFSSIPYRGGAQAVTDMLGGHIHMNFGSTSTLLPLIRDGRVRALAVSSAVRTTDLPEVPTMIESGFPNVTGAAYFGILGPAGLPADVVNRINNSANESLKSSELIANMAKAGFEPKSGSPQDFASLLAAEMRKWLPIVTTSGLQIE
jgi:tripartite-type tricarboxylate transporter receptor subunit TctC